MGVFFFPDGVIGTRAGLDSDVYCFCGIKRGVMGVYDYQRSSGVERKALFLLGKSLNVRLPLPCLIISGFFSWLYHWYMGFLALET